jgi:hypothetical protein
MDEVNVDLDSLESLYRSEVVLKMFNEIDKSMSKVIDEEKPTSTEVSITLKLIDLKLEALKQVSIQTQYDDTGNDVYQ